jgi:hypothetical protein
MKYGEVIKRAVDIETIELLLFLNTFDIKWNMAIIFIDKKNIEIKKIPIKEGLELNISL